MFSNDTALSRDERSAILDDEIGRYIGHGYRVTARTATTAQLVRPKTFSVAAAIFWTLFLLVGLVIYLLIYAAKADESLYLSVGPDGTITRRGANADGSNRDDGRWLCHCGYRTQASRPRCKRCQSPREDAA